MQEELCEVSSEISVISPIQPSPEILPISNAPRAVLKGAETLSQCKAEIGVSFYNVYHIIESNLRILENPAKVSSRDSGNRIDNYLAIDTETLEQARVNITNVLFHSVRLNEWQMIFRGVETKAEGAPTIRLEAFELKGPRAEEWLVRVTPDEVTISRPEGLITYTLLESEGATALFTTLECVKTALASGDFFKDDDEEWEDCNVESDDDPLSISAHLYLEDDLTPEQIRAAGTKAGLTEMLDSLIRDTRVYPLFANRILELIVATRDFSDWDFNPVDMVLGLHLGNNQYIRLTESLTSIFRDNTGFNIATGKNAKTVYGIVMAAKGVKPLNSVEDADDSDGGLFESLDLTATEESEEAALFAQPDTIDTFGMEAINRQESAAPKGEIETAPPSPQQEPVQPKEPESMTQNSEDNKPATVDTRTVNKDPLKFLKSAEGRVLSVMEACIPNDTQREAIKTLIKKEFRSVMNRYGKVSNDEEIDD
jgi:hypothetical protein